MFRIEQEPRYWWPVVVKRPDPAKPGQMAEHRFEAEYRWLSDLDHDALIRECIDKQLLTVDAVPRVCTGFRQVQQADGSTPDLATLLQQQGVARAMWQAYMDSRSQAEEKNS